MTEAGRVVAVAAGRPAPHAASLVADARRAVSVDASFVADIYLDCDRGPLPSPRGRPLIMRHQWC